MENDCVVVLVNPPMMDDVQQGRRKFTVCGVLVMASIR